LLAQVWQLYSYTPGLDWFTKYSAQLDIVFIKWQMDTFDYTLLTSEEKQVSNSLPMLSPMQIYLFAAHALPHSLVLMSKMSVLLVHLHHSLSTIARLSLLIVEQVFNPLLQSPLERGYNPDVQALQ